MTQSTGGKDMNELPHVSDLQDYERHQRTTAQQAGVAALEHELHGETTDVIEIALWVRGRELRTSTDSATIERIMRILTGLEQ
jgi:hypothetical protein